MFGKLEVHVLEVVWRFEPITFYIGSLKVKLILAPYVCGECMVHEIGLVEDEWLFSSVAFMKSTLKATLDPHLPIIVGMYSQKVFIFQGFSYDSTFYQ